MRIFFMRSADAYNVDSKGDMLYPSSCTIICIESEKDFEMVIAYIFFLD